MYLSSTEHNEIAFRDLTSLYARRRSFSPICKEQLIVIGSLIELNFHFVSPIWLEFVWEFGSWRNIFLE